MAIQIRSDGRGHHPHTFNSKAGRRHPPPRRRVGRSQPSGAQMPHIVCPHLLHGSEIKANWSRAFLPGIKAQRAPPMVRGYSGEDGSAARNCPWSKASLRSTKVQIYVEQPCEAHWPNIEARLWFHARVHGTMRLHGRVRSSDDEFRPLQPAPCLARVAPMFGVTWGCTIGGIQRPNTAQTRRQCHRHPLILRSTMVALSCWPRGETRMRGRRQSGVDLYGPEKPR